MPILGGAETATELRRLQPGLPIVVMSGYGDIEVMQRFGEVTIDDFLPKPFTPDQLAGKIKDILTPVMD
jgi:two-component system, cell cycle sensor histidine kinase and response regulator CckA